MGSRLQTLMLLLLVCGCVAREQPRGDPERQRFEETWQAAVDWELAVREMREHVASTEALPHTSALFWPEHKDKPGLRLGEISGLQDVATWRAENVLGRSYRLEFTIDAKFEVGHLNLPESSYAWQLPIMATLHNSWLELEGSHIRLLEPSGFKHVRIVFRLGAEPVPTAVYAHGSEVLVASWGAALEPIALELSGEDGVPVYVFQYKGGPG